MQLISALILSIAWGAPTSLEKFCQGKLKAHEFRKQSISDCKLAGALAASDEVQHFAREKLSQKMIKQSAKLIKEQLQSLALTDQIFFQNGINLPANSCRLEKIAPQKFGCEVNKERLEMFQKALGVSKGSLRTSLATLYKQNLGAHEGKSCPLSGDGQGYLLKAQLDDESTFLFDSLKRDRNFDDNAFLYHPVLTYIKKDDRKLFIEYVQKLNARSSDRDLVLSFFQKHPQVKIGDSMASDCDKMSKSVETIVCDKIPAPVSLDPKVNNELFKFDSSSPSLDDQMEEGDDTYLGFALYCKHLNNCKSNGSCDDSSSEFDKNYLAIKSSLRGDSADQLNEDADQFCKYYSCQEESIKNTSSCKMGGPLSLADFKSIFQCPDGKDCNSKRKSMYAFFKNFEREQNRVAEWKRDNAGNSTSDAMTSGPGPSLYSDFTENFLGVEETLIAEGRPVTAKAIEDKKKNFERRGFSIQNNENENGQVAAQSASRPAATSRRVVTPTDTGPAQNNDNYSFQRPSGLTPSSTPVSPSQETVAVRNLADVDPESRRMRQELERMIDSIKGSSTEKLAALADYNAANLPTSAGGIQGNQGLSASERSRLEDLREQISDLERNRGYRSNVFDQNSAYEEQKRIADEALRTRPKEDDFGYDPRAVAAAQNGSTVPARGARGEASGRRPAGSEESLRVEQMVRAEDLPRLGFEELKRLGISENDESFVLKVLHENRLVEIPVKKFKLQGQRIIWAPVINEKNKDLSELILRSPVFSEYREFQDQRTRVRSARL